MPQQQRHEATRLSSIFALYCRMLFMDFVSSRPKFKKVYIEEKQNPRETFATDKLPLLSRHLSNISVYGVHGPMSDCVCADDAKIWRAITYWIKLL